MSHVNEVRNAVKKILLSEVIKGFYSTYIQKQVACTLNEVEDVLYQLVEEEVLLVQYELICPECFRTLDEKLSKNEFLTHYDCLCGHEMETFDEHDFRIRFIRNPQQASF